MALSPPLGELAVRLHRPGRGPLDLTRFVSSLNWSTAAVGGFGSAQVGLVGVGRAQVPHLADLVIEHQGVTLFEGQVDDPSLTLGDEGVDLAFQAFGARKLLEDASVRRIYSRRDWAWQPIVLAAGTDLGGTGLGKRGDFYEINLGNFDPADLSISGVEARAANNAGTASDGDCHQAELRAPEGLTLVRFMADFDINGSNHSGILQSSADGTTFTTHAAPTVDGAVSQALVANARVVRVGIAATASQALVTSIYARWKNIRLLGTSLAEDAAGGFWIPTLLRDLIALVPSLSIGLIEDDTDFVVEQLHRSARSSIMSAIDEVTAYSLREWAVWEGKRFDWRLPNFDVPDWVLTLSDCRSINLRTSADGLARTVYLSYVDAADGREREVSAAASDQRNPYVKLAQTKDLIVSSGGRVTATAAQQLADNYIEENGKYPPTAGSVRLSVEKVVRRARGAPQPAYAIRAGQQVLITDLPKTDPLSLGRDSQTLFHIVSTEVDSTAGTVTLELENQSRRLDVLLARLAAAIR